MTIDTLLIALEIMRFGSGPKFCGAAPTRGGRISLLLLASRNGRRGVERQLHQSDVVRRTMCDYTQVHCKCSQLHYTVRA